MFKKVIAICLGTAMALSVCSCGEQSSGQPTTTAAQTTIQTTTAIPKPNDIGNMKFSTAFHKPKLGAVVYNITLDNLENDYRMVALKCLQGLVARNDSAQIYITKDENDLFWINRLRDEYGVITKDLSYNEVFEKFAKQIKSIVTYNPENKYETALAIYNASKNDAIPVPTTRVAEYTTLIDGVTVNATSKTEVPSCQVVVDEQIKTANGAYVALLNEKSAFIDYAYAVQAPIVYVDSKNSADTESLKKLLGSDKFDRPAVIFAEDESLVSVASENGFGVLNVKNFSNSSYFSSYNCTNVSNNAVKGNARYSEEVSKYVTIEIVQDANESVNSNLSFVFKNNRRGNTPISVSINPAVYELAPTVAAWYTAGRRAATSLISSNVGYMSVDDTKMKEDYYKIFCERSKAFIGGFGFSVAIGKPNEKTEKLISEQIGIKNMLSDNGKITVVNVDSIYSFNNFILPESKTPFYCIRIKASDLSTSTFSQLDDLVLKFQDKNDGIEFVVCEDLFATMEEWEQATTTAPTTAQSTTVKQ